MKTVQKWEITVEVLERMKQTEGLNPEFHVWIDCLTSSLKTCIEKFSDEAA